MIRFINIKEHEQRITLINQDGISTEWIPYVYTMVLLNVIAISIIKSISLGNDAYNL